MSENNIGISEKEENGKIPFKEKLIFAFGDLFNGGGATMTSVILLFYLNIVLKIDAGAAGAIVMVSKIWDAVSDPMMGVLSDRTRTKFGRRRPYIFLGGLLITPAMAFLYLPIVNSPDIVKIVTAAAAYLVYCTVSTISQVPYTSMCSDISPDHKERNVANAIRTLFNMGAAAICYLVPTYALEAYQNSAISLTSLYLIIVVGFGLFFSVPMVIASIFMKERVNYGESFSLSLKTYTEVFKIKSYVFYLLMYLTAFLCTDIVSALALYYASAVLRGVTLFGMTMSSAFIVGPMMIVAGVMYPIVLYVKKKRNKQTAFRLGVPFYAAGAAMLALVPTGAPAVLFPLGAMVIGIGAGCTQVMPWLIFPDTVDIAELKIGSRQTGIMSGVVTFSRKVISALAIFLVGICLKYSGQIIDEVEKNPVQPDSVLLAIRLMVGISVAVLMIVAFWASVKYKVTDDKLTRVNYYLDKKHKNEPLTEDEEKEKQSLIDELA